MSSLNSLGKYGRMREKYLKEFQPELYADLVRGGELFDHCAEIDDTAYAQVYQIVKRMAQADGLTEQMKNTDPMKWIGLMNNYKACAEEIIYNELIFI